MALLDIVIHPDPDLRVRCSPVKEINDELRTLLDDMAETMYQAPGIGLAAPQVASSLRVLVIDIGDDPEYEQQGCLYKLVNPKIIDKEGLVSSEEGCLSIPGVRESVKRAEQVVVEAYDENGDPVTIEAQGLLSACLQHEIDHLDGVLFIDHLSRLKQQLVKAKYNKSRRETGNGKKSLAERSEKEDFSKKDTSYP